MNAICIGMKCTEYFATAIAWSNQWYFGAPLFFYVVSVNGTVNIAPKNSFNLIYGIKR